MCRDGEKRECSTRIFVDTLYFFTACILCKQCSLPASIAILLYKITIATPLRKKLLESYPFDSYAKEETTSHHESDQQRSYTGQLCSRSKLIKGETRRNAYVKYPKRRIIKGTILFIIIIFMPPKELRMAY